MAKNMNRSDFRKIDVDELGDVEDHYKDDDGGMDTPGIGPDENEINQCLGTNRLDAAFKAALRNPPLQTKNPSARARAVLAVCRVLNAHKTADIDKTVAGLNDPADVDLLMRYVYAGFEHPAEVNCANLLTWHAALVAKGGKGSIVRVITARKGV